MIKMNKLAPSAAPPSPRVPSLAPEPAALASATASSSPDIYNRPYRPHGTVALEKGWLDREIKLTLRRPGSPEGYPTYEAAEGAARDLSRGPEKSALAVMQHRAPGGGRFYLAPAEIARPNAEARPYHFEGDDPRIRKLWSRESASTDVWEIRAFVDGDKVVQADKQDAVFALMEKGLSDGFDRRHPRISKLTERASWAMVEFMNGVAAAFRDALR